MNKFKFINKLTNTKYLNSFFAAIFVAALVVTFLSIDARMSIEDELYTTKEQQSKIQRKFTESILSQEHVLGRLYSDDYKYNIYMGNLHLSVGEYPEAEIYYKHAITLAPDATYEHYLKLLILYLNTNQPEKAEQIEHSAVDKNEQRLIKFKCKANMLLGDYYFKNNDGITANKKYRMADYYFDKLDLRKVKDRTYIQQAILASYVQIADKYVKEENYREAYRSLIRAEKIDYSNLTVKYKLALVLSYINPIKAIEYYDIIKKQEPQMLSFYLYYETLMRAAEICEIRGDKPSAKLYTYKASSAKNFYENNIINSDVIYLDFLISKIEPSKKFDRFILKYRLTNITTYILSNVKMDIIFYHKDEPLAQFTKTVFNKENYLRPNETSPIININFDAPKHYKKNVYEDINFEIYLYSNDKYKCLMYKGDFSKSLITPN